MSVLSTNIKRCQVEIEDFLEDNGCGITSSYDHSRVILKTVEIVDDYEIEEREVLKDPNIYQPSILEIDLEEKVENFSKFNQVKKEIEGILSKYNCKIETTYDMSYPYIYDKYGNSENLVV